MKRPELTRLEMQKRRRLAVSRVVDDGLSCAQVAEVLGVALRSVQLWVQRHRDGGDAALARKPHPGGPGRMTLAQEREVKGWLATPATGHGFATELWTGARVAELIRRRFGIDYHPRYLCQWLVRHGMSSQKPERVPRERNDELIKAWTKDVWPAILKRGLTRTPASPS